MIQKDLSKLGFILLGTLAVLVVVFIVASLFVPQPSATTPIATPDPLNVEEFNRRGCQLTLDSQDQVKVYCKED